MPAKTLLALLDSPQELAALREKGRARAAAFSWETTARKTLALYEVCARRHVSAPLPQEGDQVG